MIQQHPLRTLARLRWLALIALAAVALFMHLLMKMQVSWYYVVGLISLQFGSNIALEYVARGREPGESTGVVVAISGITALDILILTFILALTGGPLNPFSFLYLVQVALAAVTISWPAALALTTLTCISYGALFLFGDPEMAHHNPAMMRLHLEGMWYAFVVTAILLLWYVVGIRLSLKRREEALQELKMKGAREEKLASLATLSASAAHELATPLSTIALVARDLEVALRRSGADESMIEDVQLVRSQVDHCDAILHQMSADGGSSMGEMLTECRITQLLEEVQQTFGVRILRVEDGVVFLPRRTFLQVFGDLVKNALDATGGDPHAIRLQATIHDGICHWSVEDDGGGIAPEVLQRASEPFFSTKKSGKHLGLGLFLARSLAERLGGSFHLKSTPPTTTVTIAIPCRPEEFV